MFPLLKYNLLLIIILTMFSSFPGNFLKVEISHCYTRPSIKDRKPYSTRTFQHYHFRGNRKNNDVFRKLESFHLHNEIINTIGIEKHF